MLHLVFGGAASGKSEYAESLARRYGSDGMPLIYLATMNPEGDEAQKRILRHQKLRSGKGFQTIECPLNLPNVCVPEKSVVLLECIGTLAANEMFEEEGAGKESEYRILQGLDKLDKIGCTIIAVSNDIFSDGVVYDREVQDYLKLMASLNKELMRRAICATEVVAGIPLPWKGEKE